MFKKYLRLLRLLWPFYRKRIVTLHLILFSNTMLELAGVASIVPFLYIAVNPGTIETNRWVFAVYNFLGASSVTGFIMALGLFVFVLMAVGNYLAAASIVKVQDLVFDVAEFLSVKLFDHYLKLEYMEHLKGSGAFFIKNILQETSRVSNYLLGPFLQITANGTILILILLGLVIASPIVTLILLVFFVVGFLGMFVFLKPALDANSQRITQSGQDQYSAISQAFNGVKTIKLFSSESLFVDKFQNATHSLNQSLLKNFMFIVAPNYVVQTIIFGGICLVAVILTSMGPEASKKLSVVFLFAITGYRVLPALKQIYSNATLAGGHISAFDAIIDQLESVLNKKPATSAEKIKALLPEIPFPIQIEGISFSYDKSRKVLDEISIEIQKGQIIGFAGPSGGGKTTLADLVAGLIPAEAGLMKVGGQVLNHENMSSWRLKCSYVTQDTFLMDGTLLENVCFGLNQETYGEDRVLQSLISARLEDVVEDLEGGVNGAIGERGSKLSGGQRQRLGIARVFLRDSDVIIFDEATSALDGRTEVEVMNALHQIRQEKAVIVVAHRLDTLKQCDKIFVIDRGKIVSSGSYEELMVACHVFKEMAQKAKES